jgi:hypothetical protein
MAYDMMPMNNYQNMPNTCPMMQGMGVQPSMIPGMAVQSPMMMDPMMPYGNNPLTEPIMSMDNPAVMPIGNMPNMEHMMPIGNMPTMTQTGCSGCPMAGMHMMPENQNMMPMTGLLPQTYDMPNMIPMSNMPGMYNDMMMPGMMPQMMIDLDDEDDSDDEDSDDNFMGRNNDEGNNDRANVDTILRKIEKNNPAIFGNLNLYNVPYPIARKLVRRIIRLTMNYL